MWNGRLRCSIYSRYPFVAFICIDTNSQFPNPDVEKFEHSRKRFHSLDSKPFKTPSVFSSLFPYLFIHLSIPVPGWRCSLTSRLTGVAPRLSICGINVVSSLLSDLTAWHRLPGVPMCLKSPPSVCHATELKPQSCFVELLQSNLWLQSDCQRVTAFLWRVSVCVCACVYLQWNQFSTFRSQCYISPLPFCSDTFKARLKKNPRRFLVLEAKITVVPIIAKNWHSSEVAKTFHNTEVVKIRMQTQMLLNFTQTEPHHETGLNK